MNKVNPRGYLGRQDWLWWAHTPADGYAFHAGSLPSGTHVLYVAAMKDGALAGSITTTLVAARWWSVSIGSRIHGESRLPTTGDLVADPTPVGENVTVTGQAVASRKNASPHLVDCRLSRMMAFPAW
jgi:hypothetical protein